MKNKFFALWLSLACIIIFIFQLAIPGLTDALVLNQGSWFQPWRFITAIFLHGSVEHIIFNLFALILFGLILEKLIGSKKFLLIFFASGIFANLIAVNFYPSSLGASGAIYGILGALTIISPKMIVWVYSLPMPIFLAAIVWIIAGVIGLFMPSNTGHIAHLLGIAIGFILGFIFRKKVVKEQVYRVRIPEAYMQKWEEKYIKR